MRKEWKQKKEDFEQKYDYEKKFEEIQQKLKKKEEKTVEERKKKVKLENQKEIQTILAIPNLSDTLGQEDDIQEKLFEKVQDAKEKFKKNKSDQDEIKLRIKYHGKIGRKDEKLTKKELEEELEKLKEERLEIQEIVNGLAKE